MEWNPFSLTAKPEKLGWLCPGVEWNPFSQPGDRQASFLAQFILCLLSAYLRLDTSILSGITGSLAVLETQGTGEKRLKITCFGCRHKGTEYGNPRPPGSSWGWVRSTTVEIKAQA